MGKEELLADTKTHRPSLLHYSPAERERERETFLAKTKLVFLWASQRRGGILEEEKRVSRDSLSVQTREVDLRQKAGPPSVRMVRRGSPPILFLFLVRSGFQTGVNCISEDVFVGGGGGGAQKIFLIRCIHPFLGWKS